MALYQVAENVSTGYADLVERIRAGYSSGSEELYRHFGRGLEFFIRRQRIPDVEGKVLEVFRAVLSAIRKGQLSDPSRLPAFILAMERQVIRGAAEVPAQSAPCAPLAQRELTSQIKQGLSSFSERDREIIRRFYGEGETEEQICSEMNLTPAQFDVIKSRAKRILARPERRCPGRQPVILEPERQAAGQP